MPLPEPSDIVLLPDSGDPRPIVDDNFAICEALLPESGEKALLAAISSGSAVPGDGRVRINGSIDFEATGVHIHCRTSPTGTPDGDGYRISLENDYDGADVDFLVIEKTDGNTNTPDGGIVFLMTGADGVREEVLRINGDGEVIVAGDLTVLGSITGTVLP
jgi:hypothetical protein